MRVEALVDDLTVEDIVSHAICCQHNNVVVLDPVLVVLSIVRQIAILTTLFREVERVSLLL